MNILLLYDRKSDGLQGPLQSVLRDAEHEVQAVMLNREELHPCLGCFGCWFKTPGICVITDDGANAIARMEMNADAVVLLSEITYGGFSPDSKAFLDRSIQNILPYFKIYEGEMHHAMRYERFPSWIAIGYGDASEAERQTFIRLAERNAYNMRPLRHLALTVEDGADMPNLGQKILQALEVRA